MTLTDSIISGQTGQVKNSNEEVLYTGQSTRTGASPLDAMSCHKQDTPYFVESYNSTEDTGYVL